jgi:hypothetical protein
MRWIVPVLVLALLVAVPASGSGTGMSGRVTSSPTCPVERYPPDPQCAPRGFRAQIRVRRASDRHLVRSFTTRSDGRFSISLRRGRYLVSARPAAGGSLPRCPSAKAVRVTSGHVTHLAISCDSGIR